MLQATSAQEPQAASGPERDNISPTGGRSHGHQEPHGTGPSRAHLSDLRARGAFMLFHRNQGTGGPPGRRGQLTQERYKLRSSSECACAS